MDDPGSSNFDAQYDRVQACISNATRQAALFPLDIAFHRAMDPDLAVELDGFSERVLSATNKLLGLIATTDQSKTGKSKGKAKLESEDDVVDNFYSFIVDAADILLERTDICLDNVLGKNKPSAIPIKIPVEDLTGISQKFAGPKKPIGRLDPVLQHASHLPKPQLLFKRKPDYSDTPWRPTLSHKYNAEVPLGYMYHDPGMDDTILSGHPYQYEITHLSYPPSMFSPCTPVPPPSLEVTNATWVATSQDFQSMLSKLRNATELAVDLEHHSYRSYAGFLCLMQISDREQDWVVDLLAVRDEIDMLNEIFTDSAKVKVFHGADSDILWLQQDFNVYIVNLFDTFQASKLLEFPQHGLANLLQMYCDFIPDKRFQLADWRIRPLPEEMLRYARSDTHFLLYIYDNLRNALLDRSKSKSTSRPSSPNTLAGSSSSSRSSASLLEQALARSAETSLKVYAKEPYDANDGSGPGGWDTLAKKWNKVDLTAGGPDVTVGNLQREVYKSVHWWRERVAREEDESTRYVLQNHTLFLIAEQPPADMAALLSLFKPTVPPVVKKRAKELLSVITAAVKGSLSSPPHQGSDANRQKMDTAKNGESRKDVVMLDSEIQNLERESNKRELSSIWKVSVTRPVSSSLFGTSISSKVSTATAQSGSILSTGSSLFGRKSDNAQAQMQRTNVVSSSAGQSNFAEMVRKINRSLNMGPSVDQVVATTDDQPVEDSTPASKENEQDEIPYVPASQRSAKREEKDTIVVVGQSQRKRKRKADKSFTSGVQDVESPDTNMEETQEPFDFSTVSNILDDDGGGESKLVKEEEEAEKDKRRKRQKKKEKKKDVFQGDFPAPPKARSEVRSGNKSQTFR